MTQNEVTQQAVQEAKLEKLVKVEKLIGKCEVHVQTYVDSFRTIRDEKLFEAKGFTNFAAYCSQVWGKSLSSIHLAIQVDDIKTGLQSSGVHQDPQIQALAEQASANALQKLAPVAPEKRVAVLRAAAAETGGKPTGAAVKRAAARLAHKKSKPEPEPEQPRAFGAFTDKPVDTSAYTTAPASAPTPAASFGGDEPEADAESSIPKLTDAENTRQWIEAYYREHVAWFNEMNGNAPKRLPAQMIDRLVAGTYE